MSIVIQKRALHNEHVVYEKHATLSTWPADFFL